MFRLGLIINPVAGVGGAVALKGSDGDETVAKALALGAKPKANSRALLALQQLASLPVEIITYPAEMGEDTVRAAGFDAEVIGQIESGNTCSADTEQAAKDLLALGVDLILFVGGDGTARNICNAIAKRCPALGIPAGVKMHSGVYATSPQSAGELLAMLVHGEVVPLISAEVRDIDEQAFREGQVKSKYYGELQVPEADNYIQQVKNGSLQNQELALDDITVDFIENMQSDISYIMGSGSTVAHLMQQLNLPNTLLGVDMIKNNELVVVDARSDQLLALTEAGTTKLVITPIGGQGHIFGRGNQQLSAELLIKLGKDNIVVLATKHKLAELSGRPLLVDTGDRDLDQLLAGHLTVTVGYREQVLYPVAAA